MHFVFHFISFSIIDFAFFLQRVLLLLNCASSSVMSHSLASPPRVSMKLWNHWDWSLICWRGTVTTWMKSESNYQISLWFVFGWELNNFFIFLRLQPQGVDIVLDCLCGEECNKGYSLLKPMGKYVLYGSANVVTGETKSFFSVARSWWQVDKGNIRISVIISQIQILIFSFNSFAD